MAHVVYRFQNISYVRISSEVPGLTKFRVNNVNMQLLNTFPPHTLYLRVIFMNKPIFLDLIYTSIALNSHEMFKSLSFLAANIAHSICTNQ